jgi:hypothetical protein
MTRPSIVLFQSIEAEGKISAHKRKAEREWIQFSRNPSWEN